MSLSAPNADASTPDSSITPARTASSHLKTSNQIDDQLPDTLSAAPDASVSSIGTKEDGIEQRPGYGSSSTNAAAFPRLGSSLPSSNNSRRTSLSSLSDSISVTSSSSLSSTGSSSTNEKPPLSPHVMSSTTGMAWKRSLHQQPQLGSKSSNGMTPTSTTTTTTTTTTSTISHSATAAQTSTTTFDGVMVDTPRRPLSVGSRASGFSGQSISSWASRGSFHHPDAEVLAALGALMKKEGAESLKSGATLTFSLADVRAKRVPLPIAKSSTCVICLEHLVNDPSALLAVLPNCGHVFHHNCISPWLSKSALCPNCRVPTAPREPPEHVASPEDPTERPTLVQRLDSLSLNHSLKFIGMATLLTLLVNMTYFIGFSNMMAPALSNLNSASSLVSALPFHWFYATFLETATYMYFGIIAFSWALIGLGSCCTKDEVLAGGPAWVLYCLLLAPGVAIVSGVLADPLEDVRAQWETPLPPLIPIVLVLIAMPVWLFWWVYSLSQFRFIGWYKDRDSSSTIGRNIPRPPSHVPTNVAIFRLLIAPANAIASFWFCTTWLINPISIQEFMFASIFLMFVIGVILLWLAIFTLLETAAVVGLVLGASWPFAAVYRLYCRCRYPSRFSDPQEAAHDIHPSDTESNGGPVMV